MYLKEEKKEAVSPVIAVILMVAITVVLAAVLFVMVQQYTEDQPGGLEAMTFSVSQTQAGWLVKITAGSIDNTTAVSIYVLNTDTGMQATDLDWEGGNITSNDIDENNEYNSGDTFVIADTTHAFDGYKFVIATGDNTVEATLQA